MIYLKTTERIGNGGGLSATIKNCIQVDALCKRITMTRFQMKGWDEFGMQTEYHTLVKIWKVPRNAPLGLLL
jgi:hypothetical protein